MKWRQITGVVAAAAVVLSQLAQHHSFGEEPNILFIFLQITKCKWWISENVRKKEESRKKTNEKKKKRSKFGSTYLDRTYRHGGNEAFDTSWLWSKQWCFDCIVRALFEVQAPLFREELRCSSPFCAFVSHMCFCKVRPSPSRITIIKNK